MFATQLLFLLATTTSGVGAALTLKYTPESWDSFCTERRLALAGSRPELGVTTASSLPVTSPNSVSQLLLVEVTCDVPKSETANWKLNDLRQWTIDHGVNNWTTPKNRTVIYNVTVHCEEGGVVSLPWPMRVRGLQELHVFACLLTDRYLYKKDIVDATMLDDMRIMEIRDSFWVMNMSKEVRFHTEDLLNVTSDYDCGQDSSLETIVTSNNSFVLNGFDADDKIMLPLDSMLKAIAKVPLNIVDRLVSSMLDPSKQTGNSAPFSPTDDDSQGDGEESIQVFESWPHLDPPTSAKREAQLENMGVVRQVINVATKCNYAHLKVLDESLTPLTSVNHFEVMLEGAFYPALEVMNYSYTGITELPRKLVDWQIYFPRLKLLDVSHNFISSLRVPKLPNNNTWITIFNLTYNNFTSLTPEDIISWAAVEKFFVYIRENPLHCDCKMASLLPFVQNNSTFKANLAPYKYIRHLQCHTPSQLAGKQLHLLDEESLQCPEPPSHKATNIAISLALAILIVLLIVSIKFKEEIRILLYTRLHVRLPCDVDVHRTSKQFDAFVSYSNEDSLWVRDHLINFLETSPAIVAKRLDVAFGKKFKTSSIKKDIPSQSFRLCFHERDFVPGKSIFDNIVDSIEASRHTIIVLSPSFMRSHWALEELRQAYRQSLVERSRHLIVILLNKVMEEEMDPLIRRCCKTFTYLDVHDNLFWDRLVFSLSTKDRGAKRRDRMQLKTQQTCYEDTTREEIIVKTSVHEVENSTYSPSYIPCINVPAVLPPKRELSNVSCSSCSPLAYDSLA